MRLLLDEHYDRDIAERLRVRGHNVVAIDEREELRGLSDRQVLARAVAERRTLVTENVGDFAREHRRWLNAGLGHFGIVLVVDRRFPRSKGKRGALLAALDELLREYPGDDALADRTFWL